MFFNIFNRIYKIFSAVIKNKKITIYPKTSWNCTFLKQFLKFSDFTSKPQPEINWKSVKISGPPCTARIIRLIIIVFSGESAAPYTLINLMRRRFHDHTPIYVHVHTHTPYVMCMYLCVCMCVCAISPAIIYYLWRE